MDLERQLQFGLGTCRDDDAYVTCYCRCHVIPLISCTRNTATSSVSGGFGHAARKHPPTIAGPHPSACNSVSMKTRLQCEPRNRRAQAPQAAASAHGHQCLVQENTGKHVEFRGQSSEAPTTAQQAQQLIHSGPMPCAKALRPPPGNCKPRNKPQRTFQIFRIHFTCH